MESHVLPKNRLKGRVIAFLAAAAAAAAFVSTSTNNNDYNDDAEKGGESPWLSYLRQYTLPDALFKLEIDYRDASEIEKRLLIFYLDL